jgi:hypothetical protein
MPRLVERNTGSVVNVPEEKVANVLALGYYEREKGDQKAPAKASAKKSSSK